MSDIKLIHGDCLEKMKDIPDKSIDMILTDLPYGTTACKWDVVIPFNKYILSSKNKVIYQNQFILEEMKNGLSYQDSLQKFNELAKDGLWEQYKRIIKDRGAIVLFGSEPFSSYLRMSNIKQYKYDWVWDKHIPRGFQTAKYKPMNRHENILVFNALNYYPIMVKRDKPVRVKNYSKKDKLSSNDIGKYNDSSRVFEYTHRNPDTIISGLWEANRGKLHPTQKPVALLEYLIKTYTLEGETVLDNCMGSGSTGVACINTNRNFIGIEKDAHYFQVGKDRVEKHLLTLDIN